MQKDLLTKQKELIEPLLDYGFNGCYTNLDLKTLAMLRIIAVALSCIIILGWFVLTAVRKIKGKYSMKEK